MLLVPALAVQAAGPASIVAWAALLVVSAPLAITFAALGVKHPVAGGVAAYVREGFGERAAGVTGAWFVTAVLLGAPAVSLVGGYYVADLAGSGTGVAVAVGLALFGVVLAANAFGLRVSSGPQLGLSAVLVGVIAVAVAVALPSRAGDGWTPFAPDGWWAVGSAANILIWLYRRLGGDGAVVAVFSAQFLLVPAAAARPAVGGARAAHRLSTGPNGHRQGSDPALAPPFRRVRPGRGRVAPHPPAEAPDVPSGHGRRANPGV